MWVNLDSFPCGCSNPTVRIYIHFVRLCTQISRLSHMFSFYISSAHFNCCEQKKKKWFKERMRLLRNISFSVTYCINKISTRFAIHRQTPNALMASLFRSLAFTCTFAISIAISLFNVIHCRVYLLLLGRHHQYTVSFHDNILAHFYRLHVKRIIILLCEQHDCIAISSSTIRSIHFVTIQRCFVVTKPKAEPHRSMIVPISYNTHRNKYTDRIWPAFFKNYAKYIYK